MTNETEFREAANQMLPVIVHYGDIEPLKEVVVDGKPVDIGDLRDFRKHPELKRLMPEEGRTSLAWASLENGGVLDDHRHPITTMTIMARGTGDLTGDLEAPINAGDVIIIPPGALHGFRSRSDDYLAITVQFEGKGLYEDPEKARVTFENERLKPLEDALTAHAEDFAKNNREVCLVRANEIASDASLKAALLDANQIFSNDFQRLIRLRAAHTTDPVFAAIADAHMEDELNHHHGLAKMRGTAAEDVKWDPVMAACSAWFADRMTHGTDAEKTVLMHFVIEQAGDIYYRNAAPLFPDSKHFQGHSQDDADHTAMGWEALRQRPNEPVDQLVKYLDHGWAVMNELCNRMADLAVLEASRPTKLPAHLSSSLTPAGIQGAGG